jgi:triosephosphate isomerase
VRRPLIVGNWKMNTSREEASALARALVAGPGASAAASGSAEVVICPPFPWLTDVAAIVDGSGIGVGAQTMHPEPGGAYTGEVSPRMLRGLCRFVLVGQYERRMLFSEKDALVRRKLQAAQQNAMQPILCVGEDADQLDEGTGVYVVAEQIEADLDGAALDERLVIAYEPSWTTIGRVAPPPVAYVADMIDHMRETLSELYSSTVAEQTRLIYGGQINPRNIAEIAAQPRIDGLLVGTASTSATSFAALIEAFVDRL